MKRANRFWIAGISVMAYLLGVAHWFSSRPIYAQQDTQHYDDGSVYIYAGVDVDSNYYLYTQSYTQWEFDAYEDIDGVQDEIRVDKDQTVFYDDYAAPDPTRSDYGQLKSDNPVATGHEYGVTSIGYVCIDDEEGGCTWSPYPYASSPHASVNVANPSPHIDSISPSSANEGDQGTLTISGSNLVESAGDQLTINYSGSGMPFTLTGTPSSSTASFTYDFTGYTPGTYTISVTNNEDTSNSKSFTVNPPLNACSQSTVPNSVTLQIAALGNQSGTFTLSHPTATVTAATTTVSYGPFSTPSSVASSLASAITRNYAHLGITAQANGPSITIQSRNTFGSLSVTSPGSTSNIGIPTSVSCVVLPTLPCTGLFPDYDYTRTNPYDDGSTTPRQHIINKHINGTPTVTPPNTVYVNPGGYSVDDMFLLVKAYNFTTVFLNPIPVNGAFQHKYSKITQITPTGSVDKGWIGKDGSGNDLYTNKLYLSADRCRVNTSYPVAP